LLRDAQQTLRRTSFGRREHRVMGHPHWPLFDLEVRTPRLVLRYLDDELGCELATLAAKGVHDPSWMPFAIGWTDLPSPDLERNALRYWWSCRAATAPEQWEINLAVLVGGVPAGVTSLGASDFPITRAFHTGSWLGRDFQGRGIGTEMRLATLHLGFAGFGAERATTAAFVDNAASLGVTRKLGYAPNGTTVAARRGVVGEQQHFLLARPAWHDRRRDDIDLAGVDEVRELLEIPDGVS
jgi:RimJ/RimL family protein N-acetyltransferase